jgi:hypothetical protein
LLKKGRIAALAATVVLLSLAVIVPAGSARSTGNSVLWNQYGNSVPTRYCANSACAVQFYLPQGTAVQMVCYVDTYPAATGNYTSTRWFQVAYTHLWWTNYTWVHSSYVYYQTWVKHC